MSDREDTFLFAVVESDEPAGRRVPEDATVRHEALDTTRSLLVQAPAGAGKTSLLTQRYLALLPTVEQPEQILAITFTRLATAEMRERILLALERARKAPEPQLGEDAELELARAALRHGEAMGWQLLEQPGRLDIQSIDALALRIAHGQPMLARLGGALAPSEYAEPLYAAAARRTMGQLHRSEGAQAAVQEALGHLLRHRDNHLTKLEGLLADALKARDAWLPVLPIYFGPDTDWAGIRAAFERPFAEENARVLHALHEAFASMPEVAAELLALCNYAGGTLQEQGEGGEAAYSPKAGCPDLRSLRALDARPGAAALSRETWLCIAEFLLTQGCTWRKKFDKSQGIPPKGDGTGKAEREGWKARAVACVASLQQGPMGGLLLRNFAALRVLPAERFSELQWETLRAIFTVLRHATAELRLVFAEANTVDFTEIALAAEDVLADPDSMRGLLESEHKQHLLIDEFQDTSRTQFRLIAHLIREWTPGDGRTVFLVGDPLQSIYAFRQAEVALFHQTREHGLPCGAGRHPCAPLQLTHNFRSHSGLVDALNEWFRAMWAEEDEPVAEPAFGEDTFTAAQAWPYAHGHDALQLHPVFFDTEAESVAEAREREAAAVVSVVQSELLQMQAALERGEPEYRIAILFRSRSHLAHILPAMRVAGIGYRGVELEPLGEQTEVRDLHLLLRALLHPADRIAWLSLLRAPWCGLTLRDLHALTGHDDAELMRQTIMQRIAACMRGETAVSQDGMARLSRVWAIVEDALQTRYTAGNTLSLSQWLERTWTALGGPACLAGSGHDNADAFFRLLDEVAPCGVSLAETGSALSEFALRLSRLYAAPDPRASERFGVQIMSIHKAKGLGFQAVLLPGLERKAKGDPGRLLHLLERAQRSEEPGASEVLLCPVGASEGPESAGEDAGAIADWLKKLEKARAEAERKRLFYVACTRARLRLHLFACVASKEKELCKPDSTSLLGAAWAALGPRLQAASAEALAGSRGALALAASADARLQEPVFLLPLVLQMSGASDTVNQLDRLPADYRPRSWAEDIAFDAPLPETAPLFTRAEGSLAARARGTAMHALLQQLAALSAQPPDESMSEERGRWRGLLMQTASYSLRRNGYAAAGLRATANALVEQALAVAETASGQWLFEPYAFSLVEASWQAAGGDGTPQTIRVDRCFIGGNPPGEDARDEEQSLWLIDYKSAVSAPVGDRSAVEAWLAEQKLLYRSQLEAYADIVGKDVGSSLIGARPVRFGLYFPEILELMTW